MAKERNLEGIEAEMAKIQERRRALHADLKALADERRELLKSQERPAAPGSVTVTPDPADLTAQTN